MSLVKIRNKFELKKLPLEIFCVYCFMANFSMVCSNPKKFRISKLADCSKHVQLEFSG